MVGEPQIFLLSWFLSVKHFNFVCTRGRGKDKSEYRRVHPAREFGTMHKATCEHEIYDQNDGLADIGQRRQICDSVEQA